MDKIQLLKDTLIESITTKLNSINPNSELFNNVTFTSCNGTKGEFPLMAFADRTNPNSVDVIGDRKIIIVKEGRKYSLTLKNAERLSLESLMRIDGCTIDGSLVDDSWDDGIKNRFPKGTIVEWGNHGNGLYQVIGYDFTSKCKPKLVVQAIRFNDALEKYEVQRGLGNYSLEEHFVSTPSKSIERERKNIEGIEKEIQSSIKSSLTRIRNLENQLSRAKTRRDVFEKFLLEKGCLCSETV